MGEAKQSKTEKITLAVIARMIYLLGYYIFWANTGPAWQQPREDWNRMAEDLGLRHRT